MSLGAELKKFELSSVFTINFSWLKRYVESNKGMYTPMKNISDDEFREIENFKKSNNLKTNDEALQQILKALT